MSLSIAQNATHAGVAGPGVTRTCGEGHGRGSPCAGQEPAVGREHGLGGVPYAGRDDAWAL